MTLDPGPGCIVAVPVVAVAMKKRLNILLVVFMAWLPVSQAAALCCPTNDPSSEEPVMQSGHSMEHCGDHEAAKTSASDPANADLNDHDTSCLSACLQLGHMPLPVQTLTLRPFYLAKHVLLKGRTALQPAHHSPPLRPPAALLI